MCHRRNHTLVRSTTCFFVSQPDNFPQWQTRHEEVVEEPVVVRVALWVVRVALWVVRVALWVVRVERRVVRVERRVESVERFFR